MWHRLCHIHIPYIFQIFTPNMTGPSTSTLAAWPLCNHTTFKSILWETLSGSFSLLSLNSLSHPFSWDIDNATSIFRRKRDTLISKLEVKYLFMTLILSYGICGEVGVERLRPESLLRDSGESSGVF